jgi:uncharacterized protein (TIGR00266 family)
MKCHEIEYEIHGDDMQVVEIELDPSETVIAEAGMMNWMDTGIAFEAKLGDGSQPDEGFFDKVWSAAKRKITGESLFMTHFTNVGQGKKRAAFAAPFPGKIIPINMAECGNQIFLQKDAFLCAALGTEINIAFTKKFGAGLFGGEGFIIQHLKGDGLAFVHAGGTVVKKTLQAGEQLKIDTGCIVGYTHGVEYSIERAGGLKSMVFGGEGLFLATLKGPGTIFLQTLPFSRLADRIFQHAPKLGGKRQGEGSILGKIGDMIDGS